MRNRSLRFPNLVLAVSAAAVILAVASSPASAQNVTVYPAKFICGFQTGNVPLLADPDPYPHEYEELKPGNYATAINITNITLPSQNVSVFALVEDNRVSPPVSRAFTVSFVTIPGFGIATIGCPEIVAALNTGPFGFGLTGQAIEGVALIFANGAGDPLDVTGVYTYSSQNAFERHAVWGLQEDLFSFSLLTDSPYFFGILSLLGSIPDPLPEPKEVEPIQDLAASGAGGLGLGASIDVENFPGRVTSTTMAQVRALIDEQM